MLCALYLRAPHLLPRQDGLPDYTFTAVGTYKFRFELSCGLILKCWTRPTPQTIFCYSSRKVITRLAGFSLQLYRFFWRIISITLPLSLWTIMLCETHHGLQQLQVLKYCTVILLETPTRWDWYDSVLLTWTALPSTSMMDDQSICGARTDGNNMFTKLEPFDSDFFTSSFYFISVQFHFRIMWEFKTELQKLCTCNIIKNKKAIFQNFLHSKLILIPYSRYLYKFIYCYVLYTESVLSNLDIVLW